MSLGGGGGGGGGDICQQKFDILVILNILSSGGQRLCSG